MRKCRGGCGKDVVPPRYWCSPCKFADDDRLMDVRRVGQRRNNGDVLSFDHYPTPVSKGGTGAVENVVVACLACNRQRGDRQDA